MPLAPNSLLQAAPAVKPQASPANAQATAADARAKAPGFAQVFAKESKAAPTKAVEMAPKPSRDKPADASVKKDTGNDKPAAGTPAVADSGKTLPATPPSKADAAAGSDDDKSADKDLAQAQPPAVDPLADPALIAAVTPAPAAVQAGVVDDATTPLLVTTPPLAEEVAPAFDPEADPLDALPAVRLAMEQGGHVSASSQAAQKSLPTQAEPTAAQSFTNGLAAMVDQQAAKDSTDQGGEKAFSGLIEEGLKDLKGASSDTRVDDFANRLAALTQAATPKTANALPLNNQPLAMHQSGWTEEVVNRVMYLSSANLKSADIQLQPAELGRLDIRVSMTADQQAQVNFMSGHAIVREALESQSARLREMFAQQGMGQVDVNVSDQSRGWQGQGQEQQNQARGVSGTGGHSDGHDGGIAGDVSEVAAPLVQSVIGSSAVDYYA
ncbi:flagellar hook-length control protein FliK [Pseudomonas fluorescens]|uniref:Flagellar hook-length control protein FliK n=2 Tax=Pseudomonas fluorescens group TaxID=136843 RepID=A0ABS9FCT1_9PSED|nr:MULTISPECIES: flagellar hook-length control protein FliK [Pseudomonas fluorescens group]AIG05456.1 flagellar hook-length control protein [Pseudomonas fluorescens]MCF4980354.1 flagellar hook-length control protein FliK [Pseudomonas gessardii]MCF4989399.1 flagellar hook-length control protein FliK [Pseudomonas gessardii]MCF5085458.1 flagellar hook-length control protein FliK [Pseudomonas gessardii]MCF5094091.1 flagellar hook-length control protein FliK [Pseudomonas gessardii]